eukprot:m.34952 g.34952  ORF g.34952 m.34952 type:complete len:368 (-) comp17060_c0_seq1:224-1327(-)
MGILDKIKDIELEMGRTQKNKATESHLGVLKAKLARYRNELIVASETKSAKGEGFEVVKSGDARVAMIGFPSVGKSTLLNKLTSTASECADFEFTTLTCIPGNIEYRDARIQLLDLPGIIEGASGGKGRGKQVIAVARTADLIMYVLDASKGEVHRRLLERELHTCGIRTNKTPPDITFKQKSGGSVSFNSTVKLTKLGPDPLRTITMVLKELKISNADVLFRGDYDSDDFIDVILGNRVYTRALYLYNKCDLVSIEEIDRLARLPNSVVVSSMLDLNYDRLLENIWDYLGLVRVYTKKQGDPPHWQEPVVLRTGAKIRDVCRGIHATLVDDFKAAVVWGTSCKHSPMRVSIAHEVNDEDVCMILKK